MKRLPFLRVIRLLASNLFLLILLFVGAYFMLVRVDTLQSGEELPDYRLIDSRGRTVHLSDFEGKWVLLDFWFKGCAPCLAEMRQFPRLLEKHSDRLVILSISTDPPQRTKELLSTNDGKWGFLRDNDDSWRFFNDRGTAFEYVQSLRVRQYPTYALIDPEGHWVSSPRSGVLAVEGRLSRYPDLLLITSLIWDKLYLPFGRILISALILMLGYEGYRWLKNKKSAFSTL